jgi:hypothetical protein
MRYKKQKIARSSHKILLRSFIELYISLDYLCSGHIACCWVPGSRPCRYILSDNGFLHRTTRSTEYHVHSDPTCSSALQSSFRINDTSRWSKSDSKQWPITEFRQWSTLIFWWEKWRTNMLQLSLSNLQIYSLVHKTHSRQFYKIISCLCLFLRHAINRCKKLH